MRTCIKMCGISTSFFQPKLHNTYFSKFFTYRTRSWFETLFRPAFIWQILSEKKNSAKTTWLMMHFRGTQIVCQITLNVQFSHCLNKSSNESRSNYTITKTRSLVQVCIQPFISPLLLYSKKTQPRWFNSENWIFTSFDVRGTLLNSSIWLNF